jgi:hypothetical protein
MWAVAAISAAAAIPPAEFLILKRRPFTPSPGLDPGVHVFEIRIPQKKRWMPTDQVRGLKAHGSSPAKGLRE